MHGNLNWSKATNRDTLSHTVARKFGARSASNKNGWRLSTLNSSTAKLFFILHFFARRKRHFFFTDVWKQRIQNGWGSLSRHVCNACWLVRSSAPATPGFNGRLTRRRCWGCCDACKLCRWPGAQARLSHSSCSKHEQVRCHGPLQAASEACGHGDIIAAGMAPISYNQVDSPARRTWIVGVTAMTMSEPMEGVVAWLRKVAARLERVCGGCCWWCSLPYVLWILILIRLAFVTGTVI